MSSFDPNAFLGSALDKPLVKRPLLAAGIPYSAIIQPLKVRSGTTTGKDGQPRDWVAFDIPMEIEVPADQQATVGQPKITLSDSVFIDSTPSGGLDMAPGRNRGLRRYYDATGLNKPGTTPNHLPGNLIKVILKHEVAKDGSGDLYERVDSIQKA
jgi:hypothetical protein